MSTITPPPLTPLPGSPSDEPPEAAPTGSRGKRWLRRDTEDDPGGRATTGSQQKPWYKRDFYLGRAVKPEIVMNFSRQASSFLRAGIPILEALAIVGEETSSEKMGEVLGEVRLALQSGASFGEAIARHPKVFPGYYIAMVRASELTGGLAEVLEQLATYLERDLAARRQVKSALTYPAFVMGLALMAVVVMASWVLPKFKGLYASLGANLPLPTRMLLGITDFFADSWALVLVVLGLLVAAGYAILGGRKAGKDRRDRLALRLPVLGPLFRLIAVERFCRVLAALATAGVPLPDALDVSADSTNNRVFQGRLAVVRDSMIRGEGLAGPIAASGLFPAAARQMIRVGESTGSLDTQLTSAAGYYERELAYSLKKATDLFEPLVIVAVGFTVGFVAVAQVSAMYSVFHQIQT